MKGRLQFEERQEKENREGLMVVRGVGSKMKRRDV